MAPYLPQHQISPFLVTFIFSIPLFWQVAMSASQPTAVECTRHPQSFVYGNRKAETILRHQQTEKKNEEHSLCLNFIGHCKCSFLSVLRAKFESAMSLTVLYSKLISYKLKLCSIFSSVNAVLCNFYCDISAVVNLRSLTLYNDTKQSVTTQCW